MSKKIERLWSKAERVTVIKKSGQKIVESPKVEIKPILWGTRKPEPVDATKMKVAISNAAEPKIVQAEGRKAPLQLTSKCCWYFYYSDLPKACTNCHGSTKMMYEYRKSSWGRVYLCQRCSDTLWKQAFGVDDAIKYRVPGDLRVSEILCF